MNDFVANNRTTPQTQRATPHEFWPSSGFRPQSGEGHAYRSSGWGKISWSNRTLHRGSKIILEADQSKRLESQLCGALLRRLSLAKDAVIDARATPWASITFTGARHVFKIRCSDGQKTRDFLSVLNEEEFDVPGYLVADIDASLTDVEGETAIQIEILTVETG
jgi:hypothetical protein